ncbi:MAG: amino acid adenylation domain-containing protein, partial [bacterium]|nr:amino acid adenylation domain-containing protein [bacterium]
MLDFNDTEAQYPRDKTIHQLFEEQVCRSKEQPALVGGPVEMEDPPRNRVTYGELSRMSGCLAAALREKGVETGTIIAVMVERSVEMMVGIFGVLKAGGCYMPIDPKSPPHRIRYLLADSNAGMILTTRNCSSEIPGDFPITSIYLDEFPLESAAPLSHGNPAAAEGKRSEFQLSAGVPVRPRDIAYVIYTSGSTGLPKGVLIEHGSVVNRLHWMQTRYPIDCKDVLLQKTPYVFDVSVWELFWWAFQGATLAILGPGDEKNPGEIVKAIHTYGVTTIHFVPSMLNAFLEHLELPGTALSRLSALRQVFASGEALRPEQAERFNRILNKTIGTHLVNLYGPTEATVDVTYFNCIGEKFENIPIGKPIDNIHLYIVDKYTRLLPPGTAGELCISGVGLARGYLNKPELTAERFAKNVIREQNEDSSTGNRWFERLYKTGDLAKWLPDGNIEFLGRLDHQVKIRGFRIELGEIETQLLKLGEIKESIVTAKTDSQGDTYLCAYIIAGQPVELESTGTFNEALRKKLSVILPDYMVPAYFVHLDKVPLTPNGKVDRKALPEPQFSEAAKGGAYVAPGDEIEEKLTAIWAGILEIEKSVISVMSDFFRMGGHSLKATIMVSKIHREFNANIPLMKIFKSPTIRAIAQTIKETGKENYASIKPVEKKEYYPVSPPQKRLYILQQMETGNIGYNMPHRLELGEEMDKRKLAAAFSQLIQRHESLRTSFHIVNDQPVQKIHDTADFDIDLHDTVEKEFDTVMKAFTRPFDLSKAPLLRAGLVDIESSRRQVLLLDMHHIITDGTSHKILENDFAALYAGEQLPALRLQYKDFSEWRNQKENRELQAKQEQYWINRFSDELPVLELPTDFPRPLLHGFEGASVSFVLPARETTAINNIARESGATLFMVLLALYNILLSRLSGGEDIIVGTPVAGRRHDDL